ncbi:MAG: hypothetical protein Roseis2KO_47620 [Roseivirga sp.]
MNQKLKIFFGSSTESLEFMETIASWLEPKGVKLVLWNNPESFPAGQYTFQRLIELTKSCQAAVFVFGEDDKVWYRDSQNTQPRDNILLEYGLFSSRIGVQNTLICRLGNSKIASDLLGITTISFKKGQTLESKKRVLQWLKNLPKQISPENGALQVSKPACEHVARHLLPTEIQQQLNSIPHWLVVQRPDDKSINTERLIQRTYSFDTFKKAISFMSMAVDSIDKLDHHPEWENVWTSVVVRSTTWGVGSQITSLDIKLANLLDQLYNDKFVATG